MIVNCRYLMVSSDGYSTFLLQGHLAITSVNRLCKNFAYCVFQGHASGGKGSVNLSCCASITLHLTKILEIYVS